MFDTSHWAPAYFQVSSLEIRDSIREGERLSIDERVPTEIHNLIIDCWNANPKLRPSFAEVLDRFRTSSDVTKKANAVLKSEKSMHSNPMSADSTPTKLATKIEKTHYYLCGSRFNKKVVLGVSLVILLLAIGAGLTIFFLLPRQQFSSNDLNLLPTTITTTISTSTIAPGTAVSQTTSTKCSTSTVVPEVSTLIQDNSRLRELVGLVVDTDDTIYTYSYFSKQILKLTLGNI